MKAVLIAIVVLLLAWMIAFGALVWTATCWAQEPPPLSPGPPRPIRVTRIEGASPHVDGHLDEAAWRGAEFVSGLIQKEPNEGAPARDLTELGFLYDAGALYIGARMHCDDPSTIRSTLSRRDDSGNSERIIISLDTYRDRRTAYSFAVTASGVRIDYYHPSDNEGDRDYSFDPVWEARTSRDENGWYAEMRIPFSQLRFTAAEQQEWGVNINRWTPNGNQDTYWVWVPKSETGWSSRMAALTGIAHVQPSRRVELSPYVSSGANFASRLDENDPFAEQSSFQSRAGADLKMGLGPNLTLESTFNPDFGQVEADPAEVNLTAFETIFDERRPFFIEGSHLLEGRGPAYYYSRRIGAPPRGSTPGDYEDRPTTTTILGAAKLTGRLASGASIGVLTALTAREMADYALADSSGAEGAAEVAPVSGFAALRFEQEFGPHASTAGASFSAVRRDVTTGEPLAGLLTRQAYAGGGDWHLRFRGGEYVVGGHVGASYIEGDEAAIERVQTASAHYFQRPDASHVELDTTRTDLAGFAGNLFVERRGGKHWLWGAGVGAESPGLEFNDTGQLRSADEVDAWANLRYRDTTPGRFLREYSLAVWPVVGWNWGGDRRYNGLDFELNWTWMNYMSAFAGLELFGDALSDDFSRGGPLMKDPATRTWASELRSNFAANSQWEVSNTFSEDDAGGFSNYSEVTLSFRPAGRWRISLTPTYNRAKNVFQFIEARDGGRDETFGTRYVFSHIDRSTLSTRLRVNYAFTPDLTLEVYGEPFAASGRYSKHGELLRPRSDRFLRYGENGTAITRTEGGDYEVRDGADVFTLADQDFNVLSFRSNAVLRWEWRRGSTLFFVWQQNRFASEPTGASVGFGELADSFSAEGDNFIALKVSYWLPVN
jgi:hypothetical protein